MVAAAPGHASDGHAIAHDPFSRPPSESAVNPDGSTRGVSRISGDIELLATMVSARLRLANVAGVIYRPGDEVNGYRLLQIFEDRAVFSRQGNRMTVMVRQRPENERE